MILIHILLFTVAHDDNSRLNFTPLFFCKDDFGLV